MVFLLQSILFGLMHGVLFWEIIRNMAGITAIVLLTGTIGYLMGYINEKLGNGSIIPSWITHSLANIMTPLFFI
ncbi:MAG: CPBP family glutamic-type intramembrane protease [Methanophagales archaeon]|nr:CPBP family glutamic-type intramembrane protease [Methanophagales archaeon]